MSKSQHVLPIRLASIANLESVRLILEPVRPDHAEIIFGDMIDERIYGFIPQDPPHSVFALESKFAIWASRVSPDKREAWLNWVMRLAGTNDYVGTVQATVRTDKTALLAYTVFSRFWKNGYAGEGCRRVLSHLFHDYNVSTVYADVDTRNFPSVRLLERLGFERTAIIEGADFFKGFKSDEYRYRLLSSAHQS